MSESLSVCEFDESSDSSKEIKKMISEIDDILKLKLNIKRNKAIL